MTSERGINYILYVDGRGHFFANNLNAGKYGYWWTATEFPVNGGNAYYRNMDYNYTNVYEDYRDKSNGCSVRCFSD